MKNLLKIALIAILCIPFAGCKTTEANYKNAYQIAKEKRTDGGDSTVTQGLRNELIPKNMVLGGVTLPVRTEPVAVTKDGGAVQGEMKVYNVVVASFRQRFNANSMRERLADMGYKSFLIHNRDVLYYVVAGTTQSAPEALELLNKVKAESSLHIAAPFPYVLRAAHLVR